MKTRIKTSSQKGFSLIETMVAFVIAASSLGLLYNIHSNARSAILISEEYAIATDLARSLLAENSSLHSLPDTPSTGSFHNKFFWDIEYASIKHPLPENAGESNILPLLHLTLSIDWASKDQSRNLQIESILPFYIAKVSGD